MDRLFGKGKKEEVSLNDTISKVINYQEEDNNFLSFLVGWKGGFN